MRCKQNLSYHGRVQDLILSATLVIWSAARQAARISQFQTQTLSETDMETVEGKNIERDHQS